MDSTERHVNSPQGPLGLVSHQKNGSMRHLVPLVDALASAMKSSRALRQDANVLGSVTTGSEKKTHT